MPRELVSAEIDALSSVITGENMEDLINHYAMHIPSRNMGHSGNRFAVGELFREMDRIDPSLLLVSKKPFTFEDSIHHNVEAVLPSAGNWSGALIISAHLDSTATDTVGYEPMISRAPGADDDASGVAGVILAACALVRLAKIYAMMPRRQIRFVLFNAEEEGQIGSKAYVAELRATRLNVVGAYQMDMIAYASTGQRPFEIHAGYPDAEYVQAGSLKLADFIKLVCPLVSPNLVPQVLTTPALLGDSSDHASFHGHSYPACVVTEDHNPGNGGPGNPNPARHRATDILDSKLSMNYAADVARAVAAAVWYHATR